jgi:hypothetical protein
MMVKDEDFDLLLHDDRELENLIGGDIVERTTIHKWPLSNVQRLKLSDGRKFIYKAQAGPTVEGEFYSKARSPLLVPARILHDAAGGYLCLLLDYVDAPLLRELKLSEEETLATAREITGQIAAIKVTLSPMVDLRGPAKWEAFAGETIAMLDGLVKDGRFKATTETMVRRIESLARSDLVLAAIADRSAFLHGDLNGGNVFKCPDGYRVIDWTRPRWGPGELDCVEMMMKGGFNPLRHFARGLVMVSVFLGINWAAQCQLRWFREGHYDEWVAKGGRRLKACAQGEWA